jgi:hypothetical protein
MNRKIVTASMLALVCVTANATEIHGKGMGYSKTCRDAVSLAIRSAAENASNFIPVEISSYTEVRNSMLIRDEITAKQNYYLISFIADSAKGELGCRVNVEAKFDSSKITPLFTKIQGWKDSNQTVGPISAEIIKSRKSAQASCYMYLAQYVQREFRSALDVEINRAYAIKGDHQIETSTIHVKGNEQFHLFLRNVQSLINEIQDQFDFSPQVNFTFYYNGESGFPEFSIGNTRYLEAGLPILRNDTIFAKGFEFKVTQSRPVDEPFVPWPLSYYIVLSPIWHYDLDQAACLIAGECRSREIFSDHNRKYLEDKTLKPNLPEIPISAHGVDYDFHHQNDIMYLPSSKEYMSYDHYFSLGGRQIIEFLDSTWFTEIQHPKIGKQVEKHAK